MSMVEEDIANLVREHFTNLEESSKLAQSISDELEEDELIASRTKPKKKRSKDVEKKVDDDINKLNKKRKDKGNAKIKGQPKVKRNGDR